MMGRQTSDQFTAFFPARPTPPISIDRLGREEAHRRSLSSSFSQSQEQSQATTFHIGSTGQESQYSLPRYDDLLANGRHLEIRDSMANLNRCLSTISNSLKSLENTVCTNTHKFNESLKELASLRNLTEEHSNQARELRNEVVGLREIVMKEMQQSQADSLDEESLNSVGGISLSEYLDVKMTRHEDASRAKRKRPRLANAHCIINANFIDGEADNEEAQLFSDLK